MPQYRAPASKQNNQQTHNVENVCQALEDDGASNFAKHITSRPLHNRPRNGDRNTRNQPVGRDEVEQI